MNMTETSLVRGRVKRASRWCVYLPGMLAILMLLTAMSSWAGADRKKDDSVTVVRPDRKFYGQTFSELAGDWWNWAVESPAATSPLLDETGEFCDTGQKGKIWFLAGNFGGTSVRECNVPEGKALFFPLLNSIFWAPEDGDTPEALRAQSNFFVQLGSVLECSVDGEPIGDLFAYRAQSPPGGFPLQIPDGSLLTDFGYDPGLRFPTVADGFWIGLRPLSDGTHIIHFHAVAGDPAAPDFELDVTYILHVRDDD